MFDWKEFLRLARRLVGTQGEGFSVEAANRAAVNRAYYAAFGVTREYAQAQLGFQSQGDAGDHQRLTVFLRQRGQAGMAMLLRDLRLWRNQCDYDAVVAGLEHITPLALQLAQEMIDACQP
jgi:DUF1680 family protein